MPYLTGSKVREILLSLDPAGKGLSDVFNGYPTLKTGVVLNIYFG